MNTGSVLAQFTITLTQAVSEPVLVDWYTSDGTAKAGVDYAAGKGTATFAPGQTSKTISILVYGRAVGSEDRSFFVEMLPPVNAILGASIGECIIHVDTTGSTPVTVIVVPSGPRGLEGKSAYQVWLDLGNTGTEQDFIDSLSPPIDEIAAEVAPLIDVGNTTLTAQGTESLGRPDATNVKAVARRVAYVGAAKIATVTLADGENTLAVADLAGDTIDFNANGFVPRILRAGSMFEPSWYVNAAGKLVVKAAVAGDVLYATQYDVVSKSQPFAREGDVFEHYERSTYNKLRSFEKGTHRQVTSAADAVLWEGATGGQGPYFRWDGTYPKTVPAGSTPLTTGGIAAGAWVSVGDASTRSDLASSEAGKGVGMVYNAAKATDLARVDKEVVSILQFDGVDDYNGTTGTNNRIPVSQAFAALAAKGGGAILFPKTATGVYYIDGSDTSVTDAAGIEIIAEQGVSFVVNGNWTPLITKNIKANREIKILLQPINYPFYHGPQQYRRPSETPSALTQLNGTYEVPQALAYTDFTGYMLAATAGTRPTLAITGGVDTFNLPFTLATERNAAVVPCAIGDEVGAINDSVVGSVSVGVITPSGYCLVEQNLATGNTVLNNNGATSTIGQPVTGATRNQFNSALLSVKMVSDQLFQMCVNGIPLGTFDAGAPISGIAFGGFGRTTPMGWSSMYRVKNSMVSGARALRVLMLGDSTSDPAIPSSQYDYMRRFLAAAGVQIYDFQNIAKSGDTSAAQLAAFNAIGIAGFDFCIANIGINDIQGGVGASTLAANVASIATRCAANGVKFILGVPTLWYSLAEANAQGQGGQNTLNNAAGAQYRAAAIRACAANGGLVSMAPLRHEGQITADYIGKSAIDQVLMDCIHPTAYGRAMMGLGNAMAIMGAINPVGYRKKQRVATPAFWYTAARDPAGSAPMISIDNGELQFKGSVAIVSGYTAGTAVINIPKELNNNDWSYLAVPALGASGPVGVATMVITPAGAVTFYNVPGGTTALSLDNVKVTKGS